MNWYLSIEEGVDSAATPTKCWLHQICVIHAILEANSLSLTSAIDAGRDRGSLIQCTDTRPPQNHLALTLGHAIRCVVTTLIGKLQIQILSQGMKYQQPGKGSNSRDCRLLAITSDLKPSEEHSRVDFETFFLDITMN